MSTALFFGSFNPIHIGHLIIANTVIQLEEINKLWFVVSPHNPFKNKSTLLSERDRMHLVNLAIDDNYNFKTSDVEFNLPKPNYTIDTLTYLSEKHPNKNFTLIMGGDNLTHLHKWKNFEVLIKNYKIIVYPRPGEKIEIKDQLKNAKIKIIEAPMLSISATYIRNQIKENKSVKYLVPDKSLEYLESMKFYQN